MNSDQSSPGKSFVLAFAYYFSTSVVVLIGVSYGLEFGRSSWLVQESPNRTFADALGVWDAEWYARIVNEGYFFDQTRGSSVAFFPGFPLLARLIASMTGLSAEWALLIVSQVCLLAAFATLHAYSSFRETVAFNKPVAGNIARLTEHTPTRCKRVEGRASRRASYALVALGLYPTSFYFRMAYSESVFLLVVLLAFLDMQRKWPLWVIAVIVGAATATRPVGVALVAPFLWHIWENATRTHHFVIRAVVLMPLACWGILSYMLYQYVEFAEPLAFAKTQIHWQKRAIPESYSRYALELLTLEPIRAVYDSASPCYWADSPPRSSPELNMMFLNPFYFLAAIALLVLGVRRKWLTVKEVLLAAGLLAIPYVTQAYRLGFASQGRFASVVFPIYLVLAQLLARMPGATLACVVAISASLMVVYSSLFVTWYAFY